ncbi:MAG: YggS family pyridoxal phosphate-dependent enzyme [Ectobacillus sp.]
MTVYDNLTYVKQQIEEACKKTNRSPGEITIVAVTKTVGIEKAKEVLNAGIVHLGENRKEGLLPKYEAFGDKVHWHFIGSLQTRKVKDVIDKIDYLHSLDRLSLAEEIQKRATKPVRCFVQVKTSHEETKHGLEPDEVLSFITSLEKYDKIRIIGLMTMAPYSQDDAEIRRCFRALRKLKDEIQALHFVHAPCTELSMGMSNDYAIAIEEGATYIRLGTILVGNE